MITKFHKIFSRPLATKTLKKWGFATVSFLSFLLIFSCAAPGMCWVEPSFQEEAQRLYNSSGTYKISLSYEEGVKLFGGCYRSIDRVFVFQNLYRKKYILVKNGEPFTYVEEDKFFGF